MRLDEQLVDVHYMVRLSSVYLTDVRLHMDDENEYVFLNVQALLSYYRACCMYRACVGHVARVGHVQSMFHV